MKKLMIALLGIVLLAGCGMKADDTDCNDGFHYSDGLCIEDESSVAIFDNQTDILNLVASFNDKLGIVGARFGLFMTDDVAEAGAEATNDSYSKGSDDYSQTNTQVEGVDEMDNVLTDGKYIYVQNYNSIQVVLAYTMGLGTDALSLVKEISYDSLQGEYEYFYFNGMYVDEDRLIVIGNSHYYECLEYGSYDYDQKEDPDGETENYQYCKRSEYHTVTKVFEYSKEDFKLVNEYEVSGYYVGSRKINDDLYIVTNEYIPFYYMDYEDVEFDLDSYLPNYSINGTQVTLGYEDIMYVEGTQPSTYTTFFGIDLAEENQVSTEVVLGEGGYNLYVSLENIYLTATKWSWNYDMIAVLEEADETDSTPPDLEEDPYEISTSILKVGIKEGVVDYETTGEVPGMVLDHFAMDEKDGYVRIVTTSNWWWWNATPEVKNRLMVLDENLDIVSTLDGLGKPGESVQSTRFVGDYAYVVTFLRTDPFYVIDLSDPLNPTKLDELEIPGFSDYLQPIGEDYILGIGYGDLSGGTNGLKISLYDVSDKSNAVVSSEIIYPYGDTGYMWTSTVYNHKDLLVSVDKGIITLPYTQYDWSSNNWSYHTGVLVLNLDIETGQISERARVEHSEENYYDVYIYKAKYIGDYLYTISSKYIMVSTIEDPATVINQLQIGESKQYDYYGPEEDSSSSDESVED